MKATLRIPAKSTQISGGHLGYGVDILASISLGTLADALGRMEHDDLDPGERPMNADQCRDALLRELLGGWSPSELVEARIPGVLQMADEIATLRRERDEARAKIGPGFIAVPRQEWEAAEAFAVKWFTGCDQDEVRQESDWWIACRPSHATPTPGAQA